MRLPPSSPPPQIPARRPSRPVAVRAAPVAPRAAGGEPDTVTLPEPVTDTDTQLAHPWQVVVWDDPVNLQSYVVYVFQKLFGFSEQVATEKMLEVHNEGRSVVARCDREKGEFYVTRLHAYGLQASLERTDAS